MSEIHFANVLGDLTDLIARHLSEGTPPNDVIMALTQAKFNMMMLSYEQGQALLKVHPELFQECVDRNR
ncbi:MAG: hypothetical protein PHC68_17895 [Syntrophorhabdaceae bacterium]|nr:hypothetical protein [Syntrophorhabdaceae bacterium]